MPINRYPLGTPIGVNEDDQEPPVNDTTLATQAFLLGHNIRPTNTIEQEGSIATQAVKLATDDLNTNLSVAGVEQSINQSSAEEFTEADYINNESDNENPSMFGDEGVLEFLQGLLDEEEDTVSEPDLDIDVSDQNQLNAIQMIAMKVKAINPELAQELWNMSNLPLNQLIEVFNFRYDLCLSSNFNERSNQYGIRKKVFRKKSQKFQPRKRIQKRYAEGFQNRQGQT